VSRLLRRLGGVAVFVAISMLVLEIALRALPGVLVPLELLKRFRKEVRIEIAQRLALNNESQTWALPRDDDGPVLWLPKPEAPVSYPTAEGAKVARMDSQGFCNPPRDPYERTAIDLVSIGDSFTACLLGDMEQTWTSQLGRLSGLSVYNLGRGGIGPYEYLQILKRFGLAKHPRYVVMNVYEGNDLRDALRYHEVAAARRAGTDDDAVANDRNRNPLDYQALLDHPIGRHSYASNLVVAALGQGYEGVRNGVLRAIGSEDAPEAVDFRYTLRFDDGSRIPFNVENTDQSEVRHARMLRTGRASLSVLDGALESFAALAREHGFTPILSYSPSAYTAYAPFVRFDDPALVDLMPWFHEQQVEYLRARAQALGLVFVDLTPPLQRAAQERQARDVFYDPTNVHCTTSGHRLQAEALAEAIAQLEAQRARYELRRGRSLPFSGGWRP
jgi:hypothetical protein